MLAVCFVAGHLVASAWGDSALVALGRDYQRLRDLQVEVILPTATV